ncbi:peptidase C14, caspase domain-containing protein [Amylostereum chailletii]|nr:peptidase C14, caspase domain-containing protein [Amylostereum chailletii]
MPTQENIIRAMQWLVHGARPHGALFFHYSGHGGQTKDLVGDEEDGEDEVIYPVDFRRAGHLVDDTMHEIMVTPLPAGCRLTSIFDVRLFLSLHPLKNTHPPDKSCHSGSALDLPYMYSTEGKIKEPNLLEEAREGLLSAFSAYTQRGGGGAFHVRDALESVGGLLTGYIGARRAEERARRTKTSPADVISWSGCKDSQTSADAVEAGAATGAMSYAFIHALRERPQQSYQQLLTSIREILRAKYSQKPQLSSSHPMDTDILFIC